MCAEEDLALCPPELQGPPQERVLLTLNGYRFVIGGLEANPASRPRRWLNKAADGVEDCLDLCVVALYSSPMAAVFHFDAGELTGKVLVVMALQRVAQRSCCLCERRHHAGFC
jgi:hypothetical protein